MSRKQGREMKLFQMVLASAVMLVAAALVAPAQAGGVAYPAADCCGPVCAKPACCVKPAPPVLVTICVKDPVTCCTYDVQVCVPAECACEAPQLTGCRPGIFGRKVLT